MLDERRGFLFKTGMALSGGAQNFLERKFVGVHRAGLHYEDFFALAPVWNFDFGLRARGEQRKGREDSRTAEDWSGGN